MYTEIRTMDKKLARALRLRRTVRWIVWAPITIFGLGLCVVFLARYW